MDYPDYLFCQFCWFLRLQHTIEQLSMYFRAQRDKNVLLLDCRPKQEFNEGVIKSDNWLNMAHFEVRKNFKLSDKDFKGKFGRDKPSTDTEIIIYCREGRRAQDATMAFIELGYRNFFKKIS